MKKYIAIFLTTILFCSCASGPTEEEQRQNYIRAINSVLNADAEARNTSNGDHALCASKMRDIDISQCPSDFATVYVEHLQAWEYSAKIRKDKKALKEQEGAAVAGGILTTVAGSNATPYSDYVKAVKEMEQLAVHANDEIRRTWKIVERTAVSHGATLPKG